MIYWILWVVGIISGVGIGLYALKMRRNPRLVVENKNILKFDGKTQDAACVGFLSAGVFGLLILLGLFLKIRFFLTEWMDPSTIAPLYILWLIFLIIGLWKIFTARKLISKVIK